MKFILKKFRYFIGNVLGYILYISFGKKVLLKSINKNKVLSIYFHNPSVLVFESIIKWLNRHGFKIVSIKEFQESFDKGKCPNEKTVFISFDDAWSGNLKLIPVLEKYNVPITLFVPTRAIDDGQIWLNIVRSQFSKIDKELRKGINITDIKKISYHQGIKLYDAAISLSEVKREIMTKQQLLKFSKYATIGSHTVTHPILTNCAAEIVELELDKSKKTLNEWNLDINESFAYPNGSYNKETIDVLKKSEYKYAFTTEPTIVDLFANENNYTIPRICIPDNLGKYENLARMSTVWSKFLKN